MTTSFRRLLACSFLLVATTVAAQSQQATVAFTVSTPAPATHVYHVVMRCSDIRSRTVEFTMPVWTPGYYGTFDFAGSVRNVTAAAGDGRALPAEKTAVSTWTVPADGATEVTLTYDVLATSTFVANAWLDDTRGYITPGAVFMYVPGRLHQPVTVAIELNPKWSTIATGLDPASPGTPHTYLAPDFDVLYDSPILMGNLESLPPFEIGGVPHYFVGYDLGTFDKAQFMADLAAVVEAGTKIIGDIPYRHYTFLGIGPGPGGIEHLNSASVSFGGHPPADRAARNRQLSFLAHEYFHTYNVKRIRPIALGPFDYERPNLTSMLWVSEGFTVYYEYLMLARSGRMTPQETLEALSHDIAASEKGTGHLFEPVTQASWDTWTQGPFGAGKGDGIKKTISYYEKGPVLGLLLDFAIRHDTGNRKSLDTVMRTLYARYYRELGRGWTDDEFRKVCEEVAGTPLTEIFDYASTTRDVDYAKYLRYAGLEMDAPRELPGAWLGVIAEDANGTLTVAAVEPGSPAAAAGLKAQDVIETADGAGVDAKALAAAVTAHKPGDRIDLAVASGASHRHVTIVLAHAVERSFRMKPVANPDALQAEILASWTARTVR